MTIFQIVVQIVQCDNPEPHQKHDWYEQGCFSGCFSGAMRRCQGVAEKPHQHCEHFYAEAPFREMWAKEKERRELAENQLQAVRDVMVDYRGKLLNNGKTLWGDLAEALNIRPGNDSAPESLE